MACHLLSSASDAVATGVQQVKITPSKVNNGLDILSEFGLCWEDKHVKNHLIGHALLYCHIYLVCHGLSMFYYCIMLHSVDFRINKRSM